MLSAAALMFLSGKAVPGSAQADVETNPARAGIAIMCDSLKFRFSIRADATASDLDASYPVGKIVPIEDLFFSAGLPGRTGEIDVLGPEIRYERCGPYTLRLQGAAYNMNVQGEAGAYLPFASIAVLRADGVIWPEDGGQLRLTACDRMLPRASPCPDGYAVRLDGGYDARRKLLQMVQTTTSFTYDGGTGEKTSVRRVALEEDLEQWHPD